MAKFVKQKLESFYFLIIFQFNFFFVRLVIKPTNLTLVKSVAIVKKMF